MFKISYLLSYNDDICLSAQQAGGFVQKSKNKSLAAKYLTFNKLHDINKETRGEEGKVVTAVEFHPSIQVALVAGQAGVLSLFQVLKINNLKYNSILLSPPYFKGLT